MVGAVRFELTTSCTRNKRASQATLRPEPMCKLSCQLVATPFDNLIPRPDSANVSAKDDRLKTSSAWQKTPYMNLVRYKPSQVYFARFRGKGKLICRSLKKAMSVMRHSDGKLTDKV
jgi:hypothetical protein